MKKKFVPVFLSHLKLQVIATVHDKYLAKIEKTLNLYNKTL